MRNCAEILFQEKAHAEIPGLSKSWLPIGSGIIEGGIRHVAKDRLDCAGMHWIKSGAGRILELRCLSISGRWDDYSQKLSKQRLERFLERKSQWLQAA